MRVRPWCRGKEERREEKRRGEGRREEVVYEVKRGLESGRGGVVGAVWGRGRGAHLF
jgi:hypothetical protein